MSGFDGLSNQARLRSGLGEVWVMACERLSVADSGDLL
jgi:hypothetical protein